MIAAQFAYFDARISLYARQLLAIKQLYAFIDHLYDNNREGGFQSSEPLQYTGELDQSKDTGGRAQHHRGDAENGKGKLAHRRKHIASQQLQRRTRSRLHDAARARSEAAARHRLRA